MFQRWIRMSFCALTLLTTACMQVRAQSFQVTTDSLGGGMFDYHFLIDNTGGSEPLQGVLLFNANSTFGLDASSSISAPTGWNFFAPVPPVVDQISYMSPGPVNDIPVNSTLDGFSFVSAVDPSTVNASAFNIFNIDGVGSNTAQDIPLTHVTHVSAVPESSSVLSLSAGILTLLICLRWPRKRAV